MVCAVLASHGVFGGGAFALPAPPSQGVQRMERCLLTRKELEAGVTELTSRNMSAKIETGQRRLKARVEGVFDTFEWGFADFAKAPARVRIIVERKGKTGVLGEAVALDTGRGVNWALFRAGDPFRLDSPGCAWFEIGNRSYEQRAAYEEWERAVDRAFGNSFGDTATISAPDVEGAYEQLGIGGPGPKDGG